MVEILQGLKFQGDSECVSVYLSPLQSEITFDPSQNFQGQPSSLQVFFGLVVWTPEPKKGLFCQIYLLPGRSVCHTFSKTGGWGQKMLGAEF